jgi:homocysteine S-methyltransferase
MPRNPIQHLLSKHKVMILDGALGTELERQGCNLEDPLWSARILLEQPELIRQTHLNYFRAGADCSITSSYQASVEGFQSRGLEKEEALDLIGKTVKLAAEAKEIYRQEINNPNQSVPLVAGSVGPYGAFLADGSEYRGDYQVADEVLKDFHKPRIQALLEAGADLLAFETIPSLREAEILIDLLKEYPNSSAWLTFTLQDAHYISDGTPLGRCAELAASSDQIAAVGLNCAPFSVVTDAVKELKRYSSKPIIVYPNSGEEYDAVSKTWSGTEGLETLAGCSPEWYKAGARIIGGCCRTTPQQIQHLTKQWR